MSSRSRALLAVSLDAVMANDPLRELFEACKQGEMVKVKKLINSQTVNARDTAGRKSTPLHFAAGEYSDECRSRMSSCLLFISIHILYYDSLSMGMCERFERRFPYEENNTLLNAYINSIAFDLSCRSNASMKCRECTAHKCTHIVNIHL